MRCTVIDPFGVQAAVRCDADDHKALEHPCRYITLPTLVNAGQRRWESRAAAEDAVVGWRITVHEMVGLRRSDSVVGRL